MFTAKNVIQAEEALKGLNEGDEKSPKSPNYNYEYVGKHYIICCNEECNPERLVTHVLCDDKFYRQYNFKKYACNLKCWDKVLEKYGGVND